MTLVLGLGDSKDVQRRSQVLAAGWNAHFICTSVADWITTSMHSNSFSEEIEHEPLYRAPDKRCEMEGTPRLASSMKHAATQRGSRIVPIITSTLIIYLTIACTVFSLRIKDLNRKLQDLQQKDKCVVPTDLRDAIRYIDYEERTFTGAIAFKQTVSGLEVYQDIPKGELRYFGDPEVYPEIDENWKNLLENEFFTLTPSEAKRFPSENFTGLAALSVYHGLHCINAIRIHMDKEYYFKHGGLHQEGPGYPPNFSRVHMSHCLDQVRQLIQCSGDLSLVPLYQHHEVQIQGKPLNIAQGSKHTCRNFEKIKLWMIEREMFGHSVGEYPEM